MTNKFKKVNKRLDKTFQVIDHKYTPEEIEQLWLGTKPKDKSLVFDGAKYHKILTFTESDGHQYAESIELETDENGRWRVKHYQERWMEKKDMIKFYELILAVIKKI